MPLQGSNLNSSESKSDVLPITPRGNNLVGDLGIEPSCLSATRLQRAAVANAAHHPKLALHHHAYSLQPGIEPSAEASAKPSYTPRESNPTEKLLVDAPRLELGTLALKVRCSNLLS